MIKNLKLIAAISENNVIGNNGQIPWDLKDDLNFFREKTLGDVVVMGRKTFESIGKPLPSRRNVILTSGEILGMEYYSSVEDIVEIAKDCSRNVWICGGSSVYESFIDHCCTAVITHVFGKYEGDILFDFSKHVDKFKNKTEIIRTDKFVICEYTK